MSAQVRIDRLRSRMREMGVDAFIVSRDIHCRYFSDFAGSNTALMISESRQQLVTDGRYVVRAKTAAPHMDLIDHRDVVPVAIRLAAEAGCHSVVLESDAFGRTSWLEYNALAEQLGLRIIESAHTIEDLRILKDDDELAAIAEACDITARAWQQLLDEGVRGRTENEVAARLEYLFRQLGAERAAFDSIVASGPNSAVPHHEPTDRIISAGDLLKIDCGARVRGYHADMTRTVVVGHAAEWQQEIHAVVAEAQAAAMAAMLPGRDSFDIDGIARSIIASAGYGQNSPHQYGHGVGLEIHERPFLGRGDGILRPRMPLTIEPGVYLEGRGGVRIEDTVEIRDAGTHILTNAARELLTV